MRKALVVAAGLTVLGAGAALAQSGSTLQTSTCPGGFAQDACQQAYDIYQFLAPQLGTAIAGGNATIGQGSTLGGLGHFSIGVRVNAVQGAYPQVNLYTQSISGAQHNNLKTQDQFIPFPTADAAIGILSGIPLGVTNILAVDALVSATYVPNYTGNNITISPNQNFQFGYGARVGILQESIVVPGVAVTYIKRDLPTTTLSGSTSSSGSNNTYSFAINNLDVKTTSWRVVASKSLVVLGFAVGAGQDKIDNSANITATVTNGGVPVTGSPSGTSQSLTRTNFFGDVSLNLPLFKIVGEAGQVSGGSVSTYNTFTGGAADRSLTYFSLGLRLGW